MSSRPPTAPGSSTGQRAAERTPVEAFVVVTDAAGNELAFRTRDLSPDGLFLYTRVARVYPFRVGSTLKVELHDFDDAITCDVAIVRVVEPGSAEADRFPTGFGCRIVACDADNRHKLGRMIDRAKGGALY